MAEQDRIDLDAPVRTYLPWFEVADPEVSQAITIRHLLNHTSGLSDLGYNRVLAPDTSLADDVRDLRHAEPAAAPGERFHYFNPNYATLALVIEEVSGMSYAEVVEESILGPLGMTRSTADRDAVDGVVAQGHIEMFGFAIPQDPPSRPAMTGADNVISTASDLASCRRRPARCHRPAAPRGGQFRDDARPARRGRDRLCDGLGAVRVPQRAGGRAQRE